MIARAIEGMIAFSEGNLHDINHFMKVWGFARTIGLAEGLDKATQETLELAAVAHDIACPLCRVKYGNTAGPHQEAEGGPLTRTFFAGMGLPDGQLDRICYLVSHHHTTEGVAGADYRILLEADFLVNADESQMSREAIVSFRDKVFRTETGIRLLNEMYQLED